MSVQELRDEARTSLHEAMSLTAFCYLDGSNTRCETVLGGVRKHTKRSNAGDLDGTSLAYAEMREETPRLVVLHAQHTPRRGNVYALEDGSVFRADHVDPKDGITVTVTCTALSSTEQAAYQIPAAT